MTEDFEHDLNSVGSKVNDLDKRIVAIEKTQEYFQETILSQIARNTQEEENIYNVLSQVKNDLHKLPESVSGKLNICKVQIKDDMSEIYARKSDVITPTALRNILLLVFTLASMGFATMNWVFEKFDELENRQRAELFYHSNSDVLNFKDYNDAFNELERRKAKENETDIR
jgi:hypothetical protein